MQNPQAAEGLGFLLPAEVYGLLYQLLSALPANEGPPKLQQSANQNLPKVQTANQSSALVVSSANEAGATANQELSCTISANQMPQDGGSGVSGGNAATNQELTCCEVSANQMPRDDGNMVGGGGLNTATNRELTRESYSYANDELHRDAGDEVRVGNSNNSERSSERSSDRFLERSLERSLPPEKGGKGPLLEDLRGRLESIPCLKTPHIVEGLDGAETAYLCMAATRVFRLWATAEKEGWAKVRGGIAAGWSRGHVNARVYPILSFRPFFCLSFRSCILI